MPNAYARQIKQHAKNIPFFFSVCKNADLIPNDLKEPSHAQNLEIVARLFGYADFHEATNNASKTPKFNGETKILKEVIQKLNPEFDFQYEVESLKAIKEIVKTLGVELCAEVIELGRYIILLDTYPAERFNIVENTLQNLIPSQENGLWKLVSLNLLFKCLEDYPNFNDVQADCVRPLKTISAFKPNDLTDQRKIETVLKSLLPMCNYNVYSKDETTFSFADVKEPQAMMFDICYGVEKPLQKIITGNDVEARIGLRRKIRKYRDYLNSWGNSNFAKDYEDQLLVFFTHPEIIQIKSLCAVYSYALKVFLNLRSDIPVFRDYFYFDEYGSLSVNQSLSMDFSINDDESSEDHGFNYSYLTELHEVENPSSMNFIIYKLINEMNVDIMGANEKGAIVDQFNFAFDYLHESMDMYYLFNDDVEPKALDDGQIFIGTYFLFSHFKPNIVQQHFKRYHLVNDFPI